MVDGMINTGCVRRVRPWDDLISWVVLVAYRNDQVGITSLTSGTRSADLREPRPGDPLGDHLTVGYEFDPTIAIPCRYAIMFEWQSGPEAPESRTAGLPEQRRDRQL